MWPSIATLEHAAPRQELVREAENDPEDMIRTPQEKDMWHDAIQVMADGWLLPYTKHRVMMASCVTGQMARATTEIEDWEAWEEKIKSLQRIYWSNDLVWLQRHLIRVRDNPRMKMKEDDAPELDPFDRVCQVGLSHVPHHEGGGLA